MRIVCVCVCVHACVHVTLCGGKARARHKCTAERQLPIEEQSGTVRCQRCECWFRRIGYTQMTILPELVFPLSNLFFVMTVEGVSGGLEI